MAIKQEISLLIDQLTVVKIEEDAEQYACEEPK